MIMPSTRSSYARLAVILGTLSAFGPLSIDMYLPGLPALAREFRTDTAAAQQTLAIFFMGLALGQALVAFSLPETLPPERRTRAGLGEALLLYGRLLADGRFMGYVLAGGLGSGAMFAYIAGSPFVFIELNGVPPDRYGLIFGAN